MVYLISSSGGAGCAPRRLIPAARWLPTIRVGLAGPSGHPGGIPKPSARSRLAEVLPEGLVGQIFSHELSSPLDDFFGDFRTILGPNRFGVSVDLAPVFGCPAAGVWIACEIYFFGHTYSLALGTDTAR